MRRLWHDGSANQEPLERALALIGKSGGQGKLIIVRGEAGAGGSAFASRLHALANRSGIRSLHIERSALNPDFMLLAHIIRSLQLPIVPSVLISNQKVSDHYRAALHLRQYQTVICEDGHDYFNMYGSKLDRIYDFVHQLTRPPFSYNLVLCGLHEKLTQVALRAKVLGVSVETIDLNPMPYDNAYFKFVEALLGDYCVSMIPLQRRQIPNAIPIHHATPIAPFGTSLPKTHLEEVNEKESPADLILTLDIVRNRTPTFITSAGLDVRELHTYTSGLVGRTADQVRRVTQSLAFLDASIEHGPAISASSTAESAALPVPEVKQDRGGNDNGQGNVGASAMSQADSQILLPLFELLSQQITFQLQLAFDETVAVPVNQADRNVSDSAAEDFSKAPKGVSPHRADVAVRPASDRAARGRTHHSKRHKQTTRPFRHYLKPVLDETLGSWLSRNAAAKSVDAVHGGFLDWCTSLIERDEQRQVSELDTLVDDDEAKIQLVMSLHARKDQPVADPARPIKVPLELQEDDAAQEPLWNPAILLGYARSKPSSHLEAPIEYDTLFRSREFLEAFPARLRTDFAKRFLLPPNAVQNAYNRRYCAQCIADDVTAMRAPGLRKAWRKRGAAVCTQHRQPVLLQQLERGTLSQLSGAWQAYMQHTQRVDYDHGVGLVLRNSRGYEGISAESRICRIIRRVQDWVEYAPAVPTSSRPSKYALYYLLGFFLYQANLVSEGGVARWFLRSPQGEKVNLRSFEKPTATQMVRNIESASPRAMSVAYLLVGSAFELLTAAEIVFIRSVLGFTDYIFPAARGELKTLSQCFQSYHMIAIWESAFRNLSPEDCRHLEWLLKKY